MADTVSIIIATYGDRQRWNPLAQRALISVMAQTRIPDEIIRIHGDDLQSTRNRAAAFANSDWLCFLDADDELDRGYIAAMLAATGDLRYPAVQYDKGPVIELRRRPLLTGNYMVIGTLIRRDQFMRVDGFPNLPAYEDWVLWIKCWLDGAKDQFVDDAVYRINQRNGSRNRLSPEKARHLFEHVVKEYKPIALSKGLISE